jgi:hypothetical protein
MRIKFFAGMHGIIALMFIAISLLLMWVSGHTAWVAVTSDDAANEAIEAIGLLAIAIVALQIAQTIIEEEVIRDSHVSAPTRVRRYLSRFLVVVVVALSIEGLVATFKALHEDPLLLPHAASILVAAALLLAGWGVFIKLNRSAEDVEPEAMADAKSEDSKVDEAPEEGEAAQPASKPVVPAAVPPAVPQAPDVQKTPAA